MNIAYSQTTDIEVAVKTLKKELNPQKNDLVLYFASSDFNHHDLASIMGANLGATSIGCTTSGELISGKMLDGSIVAMCLNNEVVEDYCVEVVEGLNEGLKGKIDAVFNSYEKHFNCPVNKMKYEDYVGLILNDGLSNKEEAVNDLIGNKSNLTFIGGSAGDDLKFTGTYLFKDGKVYSNASVLVLLKPKNGFDILKTQSFKSCGKTLTVTKTVEQERRVEEFNGKPAAKAYAEYLDCEASELADNFNQRPLGMMLSATEPYVRQPRVVENNDVLFYCSMKEGQEMEVLEPTDIVKETSADLNSKIAEAGTPAAIINFNCIFRKLELIDKKQDEEYGNLFKDIPTIGFHTYGESYIGHINQTATMLLLK
jgi:hypothetical protein